jgi:hypothetical protein
MIEFDIIQQRYIQYPHPSVSASTSARLSASAESDPRSESQNQMTPDQSDCIIRAPPEKKSLGVV